MLNIDAALGSRQLPHLRLLPKNRQRRVRRLREKCRGLLTTRDHASNSFAVPEAASAFSRRAALVKDLELIGCALQRFDKDGLLNNTRKIK
jgi:hypothetical protein